MTRARPTLACLQVLLAEILDSNERKRFSASTAVSLPPLDTINHLITNHCIDQFANGETTGHERIASAVGIVAYKGKSGPWRAAVHIDANGQPWIIDAGRRRNDDSRDFYRLFEKKRHVELLPTAEDRQLLKLETATRLVDRWQRQIRSTTVTAVAAAANAADGRCQLPIPDPKGSLAGHLRIEVTRLGSDPAAAHETPAEVVVTVDLGGWKHQTLPRMAMVQVASVVAPTEDGWDAEPQADGSICYVALVTEARIQQILAASELDDSAPIVATETAIAPLASTHFTSRSGLVAPTANDEAVRAICGRWFIPSRSPDDLPICADCQTAKAQMTEPVG